MADKGKPRPSDVGKRKEGSKIEFMMIAIETSLETGKELECQRKLTYHNDQNIEEKKKEEDPLPKPNVKTMPIQDYLEDAVVPLLMEGCRMIAVERPPNPVATLAQYLLDKDPTSPRNIARVVAEAEAKKKEEEEKATEDPKSRRKSSTKKK